MDTTLEPVWVQWMRRLKAENKNVGNNIRKATKDPDSLSPNPFVWWIQVLASRWPLGVSVVKHSAQEFTERHFGLTRSWLKRYGKREALLPDAASWAHFVRNPKDVSGLQSFNTLRNGVNSMSDPVFTPHPGTQQPAALQRRDEGASWRQTKRFRTLQVRVG